jgi:prophage maintenance system killer protein
MRDAATKDDAATGGADRPPSALTVTADDGSEIAVHVEGDTMWLTQAQMAKLFGITTSTVSEHLRNIYLTEELDREETAKRIKVERTEQDRTVERTLNHYALDAVISVGYRVSSRRGTRFRKWATTVLRERLEGDIARRRELGERRLTELEDALALARRTLVTYDATTDEASGVLDVIGRFARSFKLLLQYDEDRLPDGTDGGTKEPLELPVEEARRAIATLKSDLTDKGQATDLFGRERGEGLEGILGTIEQTFGGEALYPTVEIRAANLLYFVIKDHPFTDGNKRIGSFLFLHYLDKNGRLYREDGSPVVEDNTLVAMALLIAESDPKQRELITRLVLGLIGDSEPAEAKPTEAKPAAAKAKR